MPEVWRILTHHYWVRLAFPEVDTRCAGSTSCGAIDSSRQAGAYPPHSPGGRMSSMEPRRIGIALVLLSLTIVAVPAPAAAQGCVHCSLCRPDTGEMGNVAIEGDHTAVHERGGGTHSSCVSTGPCSEQHPVSADCLAPNEEDQDEDAVLAELFDAVAEGDELTAYRLARRKPLGDRIYYVPERAAVQARGCGGRVVVHLPVRSPGVLVLAARDLALDATVRPLHRRADS